MQNTDPNGHATLKKHYSRICESNLSPTSLARDLYAEDIIDDQTKAAANNLIFSDKEKREKILDYVTSNGTPGVYDKFIAIVRKEKSCGWLANKLEEYRASCDKAGEKPVEKMKDGEDEVDYALLSVEPRFKEDYIIKVPDPVIKEKTEFDQMLGEFHKCVEIIIQCCNQNEYYACLEKITSPLSQNDEQGSIRYPDASLTIAVGKFAKRKVAVVYTKQGTASEAELRKACGLFPNVKAIIGVGICYGGAKPKLGDIIVSKYVIDGTDHLKMRDGGAESHGGTKETKDTLYNTFCKNPSLKWKFQCEANSERSSKVHVGHILSCGFLFRDGKLVKKTLENHPHALGGEMEGWVLYEHIQKDYPSIETISIKGVADYGNEKKDDKWQVTAAMAAASYTHYHLEGSPAYLP